MTSKPLMNMVNLDDFNVLTHRVIGCAMTVHNRLGCGFMERVYQNALALEFRKQGIEFAMECEKPIFYDQIESGSDEPILWSKTGF